AAAASGDADVAVGHAEQAVALYTTLDDPRAVAHAQTIAGRSLAGARRFSEARELLEPALAVLRSDSDADTVMAMNELTMIESLGGGPDSERLSLETLVLGQRVGVDPELLAALFISRGIGLILADRHDEAIAHLAYAVELSQRETDGVQWGRALVNLSGALQTTDPRAAAEQAARACEHFRRIGFRFWLGVALGNLAGAMLWTGDWDAADETLGRALLDDGLDELHDLNQLRAHLAALRGDLATAREIVAVADFDTSEDAQDRAYSALIRASIAAAAGRPAEVMRHGRTVLALIDAIGIRHEVAIWAWTLTARAAHDLRDLDAVDTLLTELDAHPVGQLPPMLRAERDLVRARVAGANGSPDVPAAYAAAVTALRRVGSPYHLAHGLLDHAEYLTRTGEHVAASTLATEAREIAERLGARPLLERAARATDSAAAR
ncbi:MAG: hypothetical protein ACRDVG_14455, partial [Jatrophihabitantaceae bacterium]